MDDTIARFLTVVGLDFLGRFALRRAFTFDSLGSWIRRHGVDGFHSFTLLK